MMILYQRDNLTKPLLTWLKFLVRDFYQVRDVYIGVIRSITVRILATVMVGGQQGCSSPVRGNI